MKAACSVTHPTLQSTRVGRALQDAMFNYSMGDCMNFMRVQINFSKYLVDLMKDLETDEKALHESMPGHLKRILAPKRILLFGRALEEASYPDAKVATEMGEGFPLCGWLPPSDVFPRQVRPPSILVDTLVKMAPSFSARSLQATRGSGDHELDTLLWNATTEEVSAGYLTGPVDPKLVPKDAVISPRFGIVQKGKLRPIDNFSASNVNSATGLSEKFQVESIDEICAILKTWLQLRPTGLHVVGRSFDLRKAYRQIGIRQDHLKFGWVSAWDPTAGRAFAFQMESMPFGATASVGAFLRISQAVKVLGITGCSLVWSSFYDDFVCFCPKGAEVQTERMVRFLFKMLGWEVSQDAQKDQGFSTVFQALGVEFDLRSFAAGSFTVGNTPSRKAEISEKISHILERDCLSVSEATSLRSRLLFAEAQLYGRFAKLALKEVGSVGLGSRDANPLGEKLRSHLEWLRDRVVAAPPRTIDALDRPTFFLFLDGACSEYDSSIPWSGTSVGGVLIDQNQKAVSCFGEVLDQTMVRTWGRSTQTQFNFEAEVFPYLIALSIWGDLLRGCCIFVYIDNEAAKASWISGTAHSWAAARMIQAGTELEANLDVRPYFCRVPTFSNLGDMPSRGQFDFLFSLGCERVNVSAQHLAFRQKKRLCE